MNIDTLLLFFGGQTVVLIALIAFLGKVWVNRINSRETVKSNQLLAKLRAELQNNLSRLSERNESVVHTHKHLIELEYGHYQKIWEALTRISPLFESVEKKLLSSEEILITANELHEARTSLGYTLTSAYPFINKSIYDAAFLALELSTKASGCLWENEKKIKPESALHESLNEFKSYAHEFQTYIKHTAKGIKVRTSAMVEFSD
ncbi:hypothetical protein H5187_20655 [Pseudoalteromonas sp. SG44-1]|uniref:hypothetical protein n=1 Tax=unclassified Pseudoalteromonas TaxID=194690 RepID=UPI0015FEEAD2|nr:MULTISPECIES: hypothetical protein [unclassified Pseudoalteromonas]MBB1397793.1 hypothetical protein [Pseudoalteromonas sp. SG44-8]MBB1419657.1 hypothetical protein [Pseudoalteromonas sp. SG44-1]